MGFLLVAHLIILVSQDSNVTPPVCLAAFTAAGIAKCRQWRQGSMHGRRPKDSMWFHFCLPIHHLLMERSLRCVMLDFCAFHFMESMRSSLASQRP